MPTVTGDWWISLSHLFFNIGLSNNSWTFYFLQMYLNKIKTTTNLSIVVHEFLKSFNKVFNVSAIEISRFCVKEFIQPSPQFHLIIELYTAQRVWERLKEMKIWWRQVWRVWRMKHHLLFEFLNRDFGQIGDVNTDVLVLPKNAISPIRSYLLNCFVEFVQFLNIVLCIQCLPYQSHHTHNMVFQEWSTYFAGGVSCFWGLNHSFWYWWEGNVFYRQSQCGKENAVCDHEHMIKNCVFWRWWEVAILEWCFLLFSLNAWGFQAPTFWTFSIESRWFTTGFYHDSSAPPSFWLYDVNFVKKLIQSLFTKLSWSSGGWAVLEVKILNFEERRPTAGNTLRHFSFSIHNTNLLSSFCGLSTSIKCKKQMQLEKCSVLSTWHSILRIWKYTKIKKNKNKLTTH